MIRKHIINNVLPVFAIIAMISLSFNKYIKPDLPKSDKSISTIFDHTYDSILNNLDLFLKKASKSGQIPGAAVVVVKDKYTIFRKCYGVKEYGKKDSINIHTIFRLGSVSKGFASVLTGLLVNEKRLNWDDSVKTYLPDFSLKTKEYEGQLTIRHILSHSTGLPKHAYTNLLDDNIPYEKIKPLLCSIPSIGPPGRYYSYQNVAYSLIADIMRAETGYDYSTLLKRKLFKPLGMKDASSDFKSIIKARNVAKPHVALRSGRWLPEKQNPRYYSVGPAAGVNASIYDMTQYLHALLGNKPNVLDSTLLNEIYKPHIRSNIKWRYKRAWKKLDKVYYGLGWRVFDYDNIKVIYHSGYVRGYKAEIAMIPDKKVAIAVLFNGASYTGSRCIPNFIDDYLNLTAKNNEK